jgi:hypothetical protein
MPLEPFPFSLVANTTERSIGVPINANKIAGARELLDLVVPTMAELTPATKGYGEELKSLVLADWDGRLAPALEHGVRPVPLQADRLAKLTYRHRSGLGDRYKAWSGGLEACALALPMLLALRGEFCDPLKPGGDESVCLIEELDSPVGPKALLPGIPSGVAESKRFQRLFGPVLSGPDAHVPALASPPEHPLGAEEALDGRTLAERIVSMLERFAEVAAELSLLGVRVPLAKLGLQGGTFRGYVPPSVVLIPVLCVGADRGHGRLAELSPDVSLMREYFVTRSRPIAGDAAELEGPRTTAAGLRRALIELDVREPGQAAKPVDPRLVREMYSRAVGLCPRRLDLRWWNVEWKYEWIADELRLYRELKDEDDGGLVGGSAAFAAIGYRCAELDGRAIEAAIWDAEALAFRHDARAAAGNVGKWFAPSLARVSSPEARSFGRSLGFLASSALAAVRVPERQASGS